MKIKFLGRTIEFSNRINVDSFNEENILTGVSFRKSDLRKLENIKKLLLYCFMPYSWLEKKFL